MISLWLAFAGLTLATLVFLLLPLLRRKGNQSISQTELNRNLYKARLTELEGEEEQGLATERGALVEELQHNLLDDIPDQQAQAQRKASTLVLIPGLIALVVGSAWLYVELGAQKQIEEWQQVLQRMPELSNKVLLGEADLNEQDLADFALGLRSKLHQNPNDPRGWFLLAKVGQALNRLDIMTDAADKAYKLDPDNPRALAVYAQSLIYSGDQMDRARAERLIVRGLQKEPENLELWSLYGFMALETEQYEKAAQRWTRMLELLEPESERYQMLEQSIAFARSQAAGQPQQPVEETAPVSNSGPSYTVTVNLEEGIEVPSSAFLFVFAKAVNGPPMPLAARKIAHPQFPVTVSLSDSDSMMQGMLLSQQGDFYVTARLSYDNNVQTTEGDWEGQSDSVAQGSKEEIKLIINQAL